MHDHLHKHHHHVRVRPVLRSHASRKDPTRTTSIRVAFEQEVNRRFAELRKIITRAIVGLDVMGLTPPPAVAPSEVFRTNRDPRVGQFDFPRDAQKVDAFMQWIRGETWRVILGVEQGTKVASSGASAWSSVYLRTAYQKGVAQAAAEMRGSGVKVAPRWVDTAFGRPVHADRAGLIFTRAYDSLRGVTEEMDRQMSEVLARGIAEGRGVQDIARELNDRVDKVGRTRARTIARTEVIRAHADASLNSYKEAGLAGVRVRAEWSTAGDDAVCEDCADNEGRDFTIEEAEGMIPMHPNCRCAFLPVVLPGDVEELF